MTIDSPQSEIPSLLLKPEADPKPTGLTQPQSFIPEMPYGFISPLPQPDRMTNIELERLYDNPNTEASMWLPEKIWHGVTKETMTGEAVRDFFLSPRFSPDPSFSVTPSLVDKYASDLFDPDGSPLNPNSRIFENVKSLPQFLHEIHDYRVTQERRKAMFAGGISGMIGGFIGMAASGLEAAAVTAGAGALGTFVGTPATGIAASAATATSKVNRFRAIWNAVSSSGRARAIGKAGVITAGVDVPIELAKYAMDPTLSKTDLLIGIAGAGVVGGGIAAVRPDLFSRQAAAARKAVEESAREEVAEAAAKSGRTVEAEALTPPAGKIQVVTDDEILEEVSARSVRALQQEAKARGLTGFSKVTKGSSRHDDLILEISAARRKELPGVRAAVDQVRRDLANITGDTKTVIASLRKRARDMGINIPRRLKGKKALEKAIIEGVRKQASRGTVQIAKKIRFTKEELGKGAVRSIGGVRRALTFGSTVEQALYRIGQPRAKGTEALIRKLQEFGIEDPETLGRELYKAVGKKMEELEGVEGGPVLIQAEALLKKTLVPRRTERFRMEIDEDLFEQARAPRTNEAGETPHPVAGGQQQTLRTEQGETVGTGSFMDKDGTYDGRVIDTDLAPSNSAKRGVTGHGEGFRETLARIIEGAFNDVPILSRLNNIFASVAVRLRAMNSQEVRNSAEVFLEMARGGGQNVMTSVSRNHSSLMSRLARAHKAAAEMAEKNGELLDNDRILFALRAGTPEESLTTAEALIVKEMRRFNKEILQYAQKHGLMKDGAQYDPMKYFHRMFRQTAFSKYTDDELMEFFTGALRSKHPQMSETKLREVAKRTVSYGNDPKAHTTSKASAEWFEKIQKDLEINKKNLNLSDEDVEDIVDAVRGQVRDDAHMHGFARRRINYDETYEAVINGKKMTFGEFFQNDILAVTNDYAHKVLGAVEMKKGMEAVFGKNLSKKAALRRLRASAEASGDNGDYVEQAFTYAFRRISGERLFNASEKEMAFALNVQSFAQGTMGMKLGVAQLPEFMNVGMHAGLRNALSAVPSLKTVMNTFLMGIRKEKGLRGADGRLLDDIAAELESFVGVGHEYVTGDYILRRLDDMGFDGRSNGRLGGLLDKGREVSLLNPLGIMPMDTILRRWSVKAHFQRFVNDAYKIQNGKPILNTSFWRRGIKRYADIGLSGEDLTRVMKALADPGVVTTRPGMFGNYVVKGIDLAKVKDKEAFDLLAVTLRRAVDQSVQRQSMGELPLWMTSSLTAKILTQYRVFAVASRGKQLAAGVARADLAEAVTLTGSVALGALGYTLLTYGRALEKSPQHREAFLREQLTQENMIKSGIMRSSYSTVIPMLMDTMAHAVTGKPMFSGTMRTTTQAVGLEGTVPWSIYKQITAMGGEFPAGIAHILSGGDVGKPVSKRDLRDMARLFWILQVPGINELSDFLISQSSLRETDRSKY